MSSTPSTDISPEAVAQVVTLANQCTLHDNPRSGFYRLLPGILAASLYANVSDYGRRYEYRQMTDILSAAEPYIRLSQATWSVIKREWLILASAYGDVIRGDIHPAMVHLMDIEMAGLPVVPAIRQLFEDLEQP